jgi:hypothetical protein
MNQTTDQGSNGTAPQQHQQHKQPTSKDEIAVLQNKITALKDEQETLDVLSQDEDPRTAKRYQLALFINETKIRE